MTTINDRLVREHMHASAQVVQHALTQARAEDPEAAAGIEAILRSGGMVTLISTLAPSTRMASLRVEITEPNGAVHQLMACGVEPAVQQ